MNERIRELAEKCVGDRPYNNSFDYEKFAELIVRECASKVTCNEALNILEHFGVERD